MKSNPELGSDLSQLLVRTIHHGLTPHQKREEKKYIEGRFEWTVNHRSMLWPDVALDWESHKYLVGMYKDESREFVVQKAAQMGLSELMITDAFWGADMWDANVLYILPRTSDVTDFSTTRIGLAIEASPYMTRIISEGDQLDRYRSRSRDRLTLKRIRNRFFYIRHGMVKPDGRAPQLKVAAIDSLIFDEIDELNQKAVAIAEYRLGHSRLKWIRKISTPSLPDYGINVALQASDHRQWMLKCEKCGEWQTLDPFKNLMIEVDGVGRPTRWFHYRGRPDLPYVGCAKCGQPLDRLSGGEWVPLHPGREIHGYHVNKLVNATTNLKELIEGGQTLNETERKEWVNQELGLTYQPRGGGFDATLIRSTYRDYYDTAHGFRCFMGVDVGAVLHVVIRSFYEGPTTDKIYRKGVWIGTATDFIELDEMMERFDVRMAVIDALPETRESEKFCKRNPYKAKMAYYTGGAGPKKDDPTTVKAGQEYVIDLDRTRHFDNLRATMEGREIVNPATVESAVPDYAKHYGALTRVLDRNPDGIEIAKWVRSSDDHFAHADLYCLAAMDLVGPVAEGGTAVMIEDPDTRDRKDMRESAWR